MLAAMAFLLCSGRTAGQEAEETFGCEANPTGAPIGGGEGYRDIRTSGDFVVRDAEQLVAALKEAEPGQVIFVPDGADIDLTKHSTLSLPEGVTLAGTRGRNGSPGARIFTKRMAGRMFSVAGDNVRLTGLRFEGPFGGTERIGDKSRFIATSSYGTEIDNCEVYNFNVAAIGVGSRAMRAYIHHNFIHHNQRGGLGYGVSLSSGDVRIIANKFDYCRHHIASSGSPGSGYEAAWNLVLPNATSHHFDMHGGRDRGDGTDIAGDWMHVHHNTFQGNDRHVVIRGVPSDGAEIHHNWFAAPAAERIRTGGNTKVYRNVYGPEKVLEE
ncbi:MAG: hypothetical protein PVH68_01230 [Armatimonadota bacterium]|jgi:hypothetical protein